MDDRTARDIAASPHTYTDTQQRIALSHLAQRLAATRRALAATEQALSERDAELAHAHPMADAGHTVAAESINCGRTDLVNWTPLLAAHGATTPSEVPSSHVIVERVELERLRAIEKAYVDAFGEYTPEAHALIKSSVLGNGA